jgi:hypothetical protein
MRYLIQSVDYISLATSHPEYRLYLMSYISFTTSLHIMQQETSHPQIGVFLIRIYLQSSFLPRCLTVINFCNNYDMTNFSVASHKTKGNRSSLSLIFLFHIKINIHYNTVLILLYITTFFVNEYLYTWKRSLDDDICS